MSRMPAEATGHGPVFLTRAAHRCAVARAIIPLGTKISPAAMGDQWSAFCRNSVAMNCRADIAALQQEDEGVGLGQARSW